MLLPVPANATVDVCDPLGACTSMVLSVSIALLPATGVPAGLVATLV